MTTGVVSLALTLFLTWAVLKLVTDFKSRGTKKSIWSCVQKQHSSAEGASPKEKDPQKIIDSSAATNSDKGEKGKENEEQVSKNQQQSIRSRLQSMLRKKPEQVGKEQIGYNV